MKKLFVLLPATLQGNALYARLLKATDEETNYTGIKGVPKPAADQFMVEVKATDFVVNL